MNNSTKFEDRASSSPSTHEGEPSESLCDRLSRTRDTSQRQLPTDQDYAVSTREYQTDQSSLKHASTAACPVLEKQQKQPQRQKQPHRFAGMDRVTPYQRICVHRISTSGEYAFIRCMRHSVSQVRPLAEKSRSPTHGYDNRSRYLGRCQPVQ